MKSLKGELKGPSVINVKWEKPEQGGPIDGYKVIFWDKPGDEKTVSVDPDVSFCCIINAIDSLNT